MNSFEDSLYKEKSRRTKEISELYVLVQSTVPASEKKHLSRALLLLIYAHWEGFIKSSTQRYLKFLVKEKIPCKELHPSLRAFYLYIEYKKQQGSDWGKFSEAINSNEDVVFEKDISSEVSTRSNLNTDVFKDIVSRVGLSDLDIDMKKGLIDDGLLNSRNAVAHGQMIEINLDDIVKFKDEVTKLIDLYCDQLIDAINNQKYLSCNSNEGP